MVGLRRTVQILSFLLFFFLIVTTRQQIVGEFYYVQAESTFHLWPYLYFTTNPLTYVAAVAASRTIPAVNYIPLLVMVGLVLLLGRFYCGWLCPLGVMIDAAAKVWKPPKKPKPSAWVPSPNLKFYILIAILVLALIPATQSETALEERWFGVNVVGFFDPITIAMRGISFSVQPYLEWLIRVPMGELWDVPVIKYVSEPTRGFLMKYYSMTQPPEFAHSLVYLGVLLGLFALSKIRRRFWCRYLCPLGAFHALLGRFGLWRRRVSSECNECKMCSLKCRTEAIDAEDFTAYDTRECILCMDCRKLCPVEAIEFTFFASSKDVRVCPRELQVTRRGLLSAIGASVLALPAFRTTPYYRTDRSDMLRPPGRGSSELLRPPGSQAEQEFLARCIRCGECMRVCPNHALQPALMQFGLETMWTPVLTPRIGPCEFNCTLCTQVCPTGAIEPLTQRAKQRFRMGTSYFLKDRCIPWAENTDCMVCEEVCPTPQKAIHFRDEEVLDDAGQKRIVKRPFIIDVNCIGCGTCENKCPVEGQSAIRVAPRYETRHGYLAVGGAIPGAGGADDPYGTGGGDPYSSR